MDEEMKAYAIVGSERLSLSQQKRIGEYAITIFHCWTVIHGLRFKHSNNTPMGIIENELADQDGCIKYYKLHLQEDATMANYERKCAYIYNLCLELVRCMTVSHCTRFYLLGSHSEVINYINLKQMLLAIMFEIKNEDFLIQDAKFANFCETVKCIGDQFNFMRSRAIDFTTMKNYSAEADDYQATHEDAFYKQYSDLLNKTSDKCGD